MCGWYFKPPFFLKISVFLIPLMCYVFNKEKIHPFLKKATFYMFFGNIWPPLCLTALPCPPSPPLLGTGNQEFFIGAPTETVVIPYKYMRNQNTIEFYTNKSTLVDAQLTVD